MKFLFALPAFFALSTQMVSFSFDAWKTKYEVSFNNNLTLEALRRASFIANTAKVLAHNADPLNTFQLELNKFAAHSVEEFIQERCGARKTMTSINPLNFLTMLRSVLQNFRRTNRAVKSVRSNTATSPPASLDNSQYTLGVLDQGACGSCWSFASMSVVETKLMLKDSSFKTALSPQYMMDCDLRNMACNGGWPPTALQWLQRNALFMKFLGGGNSAPSLQLYPYAAMKTPACMTSVFMPSVSLGITDVIEQDLNGDEDALKQLVASEGPVGIAVDATHNFQLYSSGVLNDATADKTCNSVNHAVVVTGYGTDPKGGDYWLIKNSWGTDWGEKGFVRVARNNKNTINVACHIYYVKM